MPSLALNTNIFVYLFSSIYYIHVCRIFVLKQNYCKYRKRLLLRWGGGRAKGRGRWGAGAGDVEREEGLGGGRRRGGRREKRGRDEREGIKRGREGKRGQFCALEARAAPRREEGGEGAGGGEAYPLSTPSKMYTSFYIGFIWAICAYRVLNPHKTVCWHYICFKAAESVSFRNYCMWIFLF